MDRIAGLPATEGEFGMIHNHVGLPSDTGCAVPTRATVPGKCGGDRPRHVPPLRRRVPDSDVLQTPSHGMDPCLIVGSAYHTNISAMVERANGVIGDTLRAFAHACKDDWDRKIPLAVFATTNRPLGDGFTHSSPKMARVPACHSQPRRQRGRRRRANRGGRASSS